MEVSDPLWNAGESLHMCYQALKNKPNSTLKALEYMVFVFILVVVFNVVEKPDIHEIWTF